MHLEPADKIRYSYGEAGNTMPSFTPSMSEIEIAVPNLLLGLSRALLRAEEPGDAIGDFLSELSDILHGQAYAACGRTSHDDILRYVAIGGKEVTLFASVAELGQEVRLGSLPCGLALEADEFIQKKLNGSLLLEAPAKQQGIIVFVLSFLLPQNAEPDAAWVASSALKSATQIIEEFFALRVRLAEQIENDSGRPISAIPPDMDESPVSWRGIVGNSDVIREVFTMVKQVAGTDATVLLLGESGTGKELIARAIHQESSRAAKPFVAVNCAALPESVIESELFGHEKGAYTGAYEQRKGRFEQAHGGTLFLDEIGELSPGLQIKLLRFLQDHRFERVGGNTSIEANVRVIAATNRNLQEAVDQGSFRADLYYRLNVFPINVPPLRERGADILLLADHFVVKFNKENTKKIQRISTPALDLLMIYHWPGNVRELENCILRAAILSVDGVIHAYHLPPSLQSAVSTGTEPATGLDAAIARLEKELIIEALKLENGNVAATARRLVATERRIRYAVQRYKIDTKRFKIKL
jgi:Nif-specific regulatory protein